MARQSSPDRPSSRCAAFAVALAERLSGFEFVRDVNVLGMTIGIETDIDSTDIVRCGRAARSADRAAGDTAIRIQPPLVMQPEEQQTLLARLGETMEAIERETAEPESSNPNRSKHREASMQHLLSLFDISPADLRSILATAVVLKKRLAAGDRPAGAGSSRARAVVRETEFANASQFRDRDWRSSAAPACFWVKTWVGANANPRPISRRCSASSLMPSCVAPNRTIAPSNWQATTPCRSSTG